MKFTQKSFFLSKTPWDLHQQAYNSPLTMMINISRMKKLISEKNACFDDNEENSGRQPRQAFILDERTVMGSIYSVRKKKIKKFDVKEWFKPITKIFKR